MSGNLAVEPVRALLDHEALDLLRERLAHHRLPPADTQRWERGMPRHSLAELLADRWAFDGTWFQARLDRLPTCTRTSTANRCTWCTRPGRVRTHCRCC